MTKKSEFGGPRRYETREIKRMPRMPGGPRRPNRLAVAMWIALIGAAIVALALSAVRYH